MTPSTLVDQNCLQKRRHRRRWRHCVELEKTKRSLSVSSEGLVCVAPLRGDRGRDLPKRSLSGVMVRNVFEGLFEGFRKRRRRHRVERVETIQTHRTRPSETLSEQSYDRKRV